MCALYERLNPLTGDSDLMVENEEYDHYQEVARSAFADMLHDTERNEKYEQALKAAINKMHDRGEKANVLDIGTGTGLLSMMAARNGADSIIACEAFKPMSECALKIIAKNGYGDKIKIIPKYSTELKVGENGDLKEKCNILVTEVFDTELIGEGALETFAHAHKHLLEKNSIVVPESATIYAQVVECPLAQSWYKLKDVCDKDGKLLISLPKSMKTCPGSSAVHDIQLSQLPVHSFNTIVSPIPVLRFDWSGKTPVVYRRSTINTLKAEREGTAQVVFMWWDLQMDTEGKVILSCAPHWTHPLRMNDRNASIPWRDHWMQAVYYLSNEIKVRKDQEIHLISCHDEFSLWFNLTTHLMLRDEDYYHPFCKCMVHRCYSRTRIGQMNDSRRNKKYLSILQNYVNSNSAVLILSGGSFFGLAVAKLARKVYINERNVQSKDILKEFIRHNNLKNIEFVFSVDTINNKEPDGVDVVFGEPHFMSTILPWDNLQFLYLLKSMYNLSPDVKICPIRAVIKAVAVHFTDLYKIRSPLGKCEGFIMDDFDQLIEEACNISDTKVEAQPLWEYPGVALSNEVELADIDLINMGNSILNSNGIFQLNGDMDCNGIALWVDWDLDGSPENIISSGPIAPIEVGSIIKWDMFSRQGVYLLSEKTSESINYDFKFNFTAGNITFNCTI